MIICICKCLNIENKYCLNQISSPQNPLGQSKSTFIWSSHGMGEQKFVQTAQATWPRFPPCPYMIKTFKLFYSGTEMLMTLKLGMQHRVLDYYQVCSNDDPWLTLTYFIAMTNLVPYVFASSLGMQAAPSSIPTSGTFFRGDLVMKTFLRPFSFFR